MRTHLYDDIAHNVTFPQPRKYRLDPVEKPVLPPVFSISTSCEIPLVRPIPDCGKPKTLEQILREVSEETGISIARMCSYDRHREVCVARQYFYWRARNETDHSLPRIGGAVGGKDHTTVLHGIRKIEALHKAGTLQSALDRLYGGRG